MIEKPLFMIIVAYIAGFSVLAAQWYADMFDITLVNAEGVEIKSNLLAILDPDTLNALESSMAGAQSKSNSTLSAIENAYNIGLAIGWDLLTLLTGTYIFNFLLLMGVPAIIIAGLLFVYFIMVGRTIIAYIRGI
jgi:hypothetical protein